MMLFNPRPLENDESTIGFLHRMAGANGIEGPIQLLRRLNRHPTSGLLGNVNHFISQGDVALHDIAGLAVSAFTTSLAGTSRQVDGRFIISAKARCCPICLSEMPYWRVTWEYAYLPYCLRHRTRLNSYCDSCGEPLPGWRRLFMECDCGRQLSALPVIGLKETDETSLALSAYIASKLGLVLPIEGVDLQYAFPKQMHCLSPSQLHRLVELLGAYCGDTLLPKPRRAVVVSDTDDIGRLLETASSVLVDWPDSLSGHLRRVTDGQATSIGELGRQYRALYSSIYKEFTDTEFDFLREAFEAFIASSWRGVLNSRHRRLSAWLKDSQPFIPAAIVMRTYNVSRARIRAWVEGGAIEGEIRPLPSGRNEVVVARQDMQRIGLLLQQLDLIEASQLLGLPERRVLALIDGGLIKATVPDPGQRWAINQADVVGILETLTKASVGVNTLSNCQPFHYFLRYMLRPEIPFTDLIIALLERRIPVALTEVGEVSRGFSGISLDTAAFLRWMAPPADGAFSVPEIAKVLGIKQEVAYHFVRSNLLGCECRGRQGARISEANLERFRQNFVLARDLAKHLKASPRHLVNRLLIGGVHPVSGPGVDGGRQVLYRRADLARFPGLTLPFASQSDP